MTTDHFPEETAQRQLIADLAAQGREQERAEAADVLAQMIMRRTLPRGAVVQRVWIEGREVKPLR